MYIHTHYIIIYGYTYTDLVTLVLARSEAAFNTQFNTHRHTKNTHTLRGTSAQQSKHSVIVAQKKGPTYFWLVKLMRLEPFCVFEKQSC